VGGASRPLDPAHGTIRNRRPPGLPDGEGDRLKGTKYLWISSKENVHPKRRAEFRFLRGSDLKTARAWAIKENLRHLWSFSVEGWARRFFSQWSRWALRSRLEPIKAVARMIHRRLDNIVTHCRH
jgi:transposase